MEHALPHSTVQRLPVPLANCPPFGDIATHSVTFGGSSPEAAEKIAQIRIAVHAFRLMSQFSKCKMPRPVTGQVQLTLTQFASVMTCRKISLECRTFQHHYAEFGYRFTTKAFVVKHHIAPNKCCGREILPWTRLVGLPCCWIEV